MRSVSYGDAPRAAIYKAANQSINNNAITTLTFDTERWDNDNMHDGANPTRLTCRTPGLYVVTAGVEFATNGAGQRQVMIVKNGVTFIALDGRQTPAAALPARFVTTAQDLLAVGDYLEIQVFQNSGGALNVTAAPQSSSEFRACRVGS